MRSLEAKRVGTLERRTGEIARADLLTLDEWGYVPVDRDGL
ncbi:MAG: ATP-binding protein [Alicyclobacillus sp.]|nr:ATP-binding protein [Alicyclobacillus sp.]